MHILLIVIFLNTLNHLRHVEKILEILIHPAEFTHASEKFEFTTKEFGASGAGRSLRGPYHFVGCAAVANQLAAA